MVILLVAALCSSLAAVSFEKLLKGVKVGLWTRNLQLAVFSILCSIIPLLVSSDGERIMRSGFFHGYSWLTWSCIAMNAFGGLLVGAVINYCDAILKDIAIGASIVVSAIGSMYLFEFQPQSGFTMGVALVSYAVPLYAGRTGNICNVRQWVASALKPFLMDKPVLPMLSNKVIVDPLGKQRQSPVAADHSEVQKLPEASLEPECEP
jgi:hypothetical protein